MRNPFPECIDLLTPCSHAFKDFLQAHCVARDYPRGSLLVREGRAAHSIAWLEKGLVRFYYTREDKQISHLFIDAGRIIVAPGSFGLRPISPQAIEAIEDCHCFELPLTALREVFRTFPEAETIRRMVAEYYLELLSVRLQCIALQKAVDRYRYIEQQLPALLQRVPLKYLASYLDLEVHTISRIRGRR